MLFAGLGSVRIVKNCDLGIENAAVGLRAAFSTGVLNEKISKITSFSIKTIF